MDDLAAVRKRRNELFLEWFNTPVGGVLELQFLVPARARS